MLFILPYVFVFIKCMDIRLSLGKKLKEYDNYYPIVVSLKEPLIYEINNIDLFLVIDISSSMLGEKEQHLREALNLLIDALKSKDRLCLIFFQGTAATNFKLDYMNSKNKKIAKEQVEKQTISGGTSFTAGINELVKNIQTSNIKKIVVELCQ